MMIKQLIAAAALLFLCGSVQCQDAVSPNTYDQLVVSANSLLKQGKLDDARQTAQQAIRQDANRYEGYVLAAKIASLQGQAGEAGDFAQKALQLAPDDRKAQVQQLAAMLAPPGSGLKEEPSSSLSAQDQRRLDVLMLILEDAAKAATPEDRTRAFREFLTKSVDFAVAHPEQTSIWVMRAYAAVDLDYPHAGWLAGRKLKELGLETSADPKIRKVFAELDRKGWLGEKWPVRDFSKWTMDQAKAAADAGDAEAQDALGGWYHEGKGGLPKDDAEAVKWYRKAAEQGDSEGQFYLGLMYRRGWGVEKDYAEACKWYRKAGEQGNPDGQNGLGVLYENGWGVEKDYAEARKWYRRAAEQGNSNGQAALGGMYKNGWGVEKDYAEACKWYRKAAEQGNPHGQACLGWLYQNGLGVERDYAEALRWYRKAAEQGDSDGQVCLGVFYQNGWGVEKNVTEAVAWYRRAAALGNTYAKENLERLTQSGANTAP
jgi:TPR repeat protein